jgi:dCMP deaminase
MNVICNAAAAGVSTNGAWLIVQCEPCLMCAKLIHHAGISKVIVTEQKYKGDGMEYLSENKVQVEVFRRS